VIGRCDCASSARSWIIVTIMTKRSDRKPATRARRPAARDAVGARAAAGTELVSDWVRERIRHGRLVPGQRLVEADIVAATGASRGKVR
jgi:hypothetical protein